MADPAGGRRRLGAYILAADPTWLRSSIARYYDELDVLVVSAARDDIGWTGNRVRAQECLRLIRSLDTRGIVRVVTGSWVDPTDPMVAENRQRQEALAAVGDDVDWVLQIDTDEVLPSFLPLARALDRADALDLQAVEWPMRVLYRRLRSGSFLEVTTGDGRARYEYPGPVAVRPPVTLTESRRPEGGMLRMVVVGDDRSTQLQSEPAAGEVRAAELNVEDAILHNSWARGVRDVRAKVRSWGHYRGWRTGAYLYLVWLPAPLRWRRMRDLHPLFPHLWPALSVAADDVGAHLVPADRADRTPT